MALSEVSARRLAHCSKGLRQEVFRVLATFEALPELFGLGPQLLVVEPLEVRFQRIHPVPDGAESFQRFFVGVTQNFLENGDHRCLSCWQKYGVPSGLF